MTRVPWTINTVIAPTMVTMDATIKATTGALVLHAGSRSMMIADSRVHTGMSTLDHLTATLSIVLKVEITGKISTSTSYECLMNSRASPGPGMSAPMDPRGRPPPNIVYIPHPKQQSHRGGRHAGQWGSPVRPDYSSTSSKRSYQSSNVIHLDDFARYGRENR